MSKRANKKRVNNQKHYALENKLNLDLKHINPLTANQERVFRSFNKKHQFLHGLAGTGKSFIAINLALREIFSATSPFKKLVIVRSLVQTRDMGHLPGNTTDKMKVYEAIYGPICSELFERQDAYSVLKQKGLIEFCSTSFIRGVTFENCIVLVDEVQNMNRDEVCAIMSRPGKNCKIVLCGDTEQDDITMNKNKNDNSYIHNLIKICQKMDCFEFVNFGINDIVRSEFVKKWIICKTELGIR